MQKPANVRRVISNAEDTLSYRDSYAVSVAECCCSGDVREKCKDTLTKQREKQAW